MSPFLLALLACFAVATGGRDQLLLAALSARGRPRGAVLVAALLSTLLASAAAVWAGGKTAAMLSPDGRTMLIALALALAGLEMLVLRSRQGPSEPTQSLGALGIVLLARQITDAVRLALFALAAASPLPLVAGLGGAVGSGMALTLGWMLGADLSHRRVAQARRALGLVLLMVAAWLGWAA